MHFSVYQGISCLVLPWQLSCVFFNVEKRRWEAELPKTPVPGNSQGSKRFQPIGRRERGSLSIRSQALRGRVCSASLVPDGQLSSPQRWIDTVMCWNTNHCGINPKKHFFFLTSVCILISREYIDYLLDIHRGEQIVRMGCKTQRLQATKRKAQIH